jgi:cyclophilin family peptidyl-prolyl cis-trans isomerase
VSQPPPHTGGQRPLVMTIVGAMLAVVLVVIVLVATRADTADRNQALVASPSATSTVAATVPPSPTPTATPSFASTIAWANCGSATFGSVLQPLNPPASVHSYSAVPPMTIDTSKLYQLTIATARGNIVVCLQPNLAPQTVNVVVTLARNHFYDGIPFHRVTQASTDGIGVLQGGDPDCIGNVPSPPAAPTGNCGKGGPGFQFNDEPVHQAYVVGAIAMANSGPNTNGSQFFIDTADNTTGLAPSYNLFGRVESGQSVADAMQQGDVMTSVTVRQQQ